jgi:hypothetical protein
MSDLETLSPEPITIKVSDALTLEVMPLRTRSFHKFIRATQPLIANLNSADASITGLGQSEILSLIIEGGDSIIEAAAIATNQPVNVIDQLPLDTMVELIAAIIQVNADFFVRCVLPRVAGSLERLTTQFKATGLH